MGKVLLITDPSIRLSHRKGRRAFLPPPPPPHSLTNRVFPPPPPPGPDTRVRSYRLCLFMHFVAKQLNFPSQWLALGCPSHCAHFVLFLGDRQHQHQRSEGLSGPPDRFDQHEVSHAGKGTHCHFKLRRAHWVRSSSIRLGSVNSGLASDLVRLGFGVPVGNWVLEVHSVRANSSRLLHVSRSSKIVRGHFSLLDVTSCCHFFCPQLCCSLSVYQKRFGILPDKSFHTQYMDMASQSARRSA